MINSRTFLYIFEAETSYLQIMKNILLILLIFISTFIYAQTDKEKAYDLGMTAIEKMESGNIKEAIKLLEQAKKLDPGNLNYPYEIAYAHHLNKNYKEALKILNDLIKHTDVNDLVYQMLGNTHSMNGNPEKAIKAYEDGLKKFPRSGRLYLERGNIEWLREKYVEALNYYEKGIDAAPEFPSNYYRSAIIYLSSSEEGWGMIYGEIFLNLERNTRRTQEMSKMLFNTYKKEITFTSDTSISISFSKFASVSAQDLTSGGEVKLPYGIGVYEPLLSIAVSLEKEINMASLDRIRTGFLQSYFNNGYNKSHPNILFDFQKKIMDEGHMEAYNYWILMMGDEEGFSKWQSENKNKWDNFVNWFTENKLEVNEKNKFVSGKY